VSFYNNNSDDDAAIEETIRENEEKQEQYIQKQYEKNNIPDYRKNNNIKGNHNGKANTKDSKEKHDSLKEVYSQKYVGTDYLADAVLIGNKPYFAVSIKRLFGVDDGDDITTIRKFPSIILQEPIPLDETTILKPPELMLYLNKPYGFKSKEEFYQSIESAKEDQTETADLLYTLFKEVKSIWKKYVDADDFHISICVADTIFSYLQDKIGLTHYLFFIGNNGSGKSNNLVIFHCLGYRNMMSTDVTAANIYQYLGNLQEGQGTLCEDEADNIDENTDKMRIYKNGYSSGFPVFRTDTTYGRKQYRFFTFCFKAFAAERTPDSIKAKGFNQRIIELHCTPGFPKYDISEVVNPAGEEEHQELLDELMETRKKLLIYRLLHFHDKIPDIKLNIENREKQLFKPIVRIFQDSKDALYELLPVISNYVSQKRESNADSLHSRIYQLIKNMIKDANSTQLETSKIWAKVKDDLNGEDIKAQTIQTADFGPISQKEIIQTLKDVFKAKPPKRHGNARSLVFDLTILDKLGKVYDLDVNVQVKRKIGSNENENGTHGTHGTLYGDGIGLDKHISDIEPKENDENSSKNIKNSLENSDNSNQMISKDDDNGSIKEHSIENTALNNDACSQNVSQASQASQIEQTIDLISCHYCDYTNSNEKGVERHSIISHPGKRARPDPNLLKLIQNKDEKKEEEV
jgi:hypothetical protein